MLATRITSKGQVTLPAAIRKKLNLKAGDRIAFSLKDNKIVAEPVSADISSLFGLIDSDHVATIEDMESAIAREATER